jgi:hypothetical protein
MVLVRENWGPSATAQAPLKTAKSAKNWGLPTLSQGAVMQPENALPFVAAWTERTVPNFSPIKEEHSSEPLHENTGGCLAAHGAAPHFCGLKWLLEQAEACATSSRSLPAVAAR